MKNKINLFLMPLLFGLTVNEVSFAQATSYSNLISYECDLEAASSMAWQSVKVWETGSKLNKVPTEYAPPLLVIPYNKPSEACIRLPNGAKPPLKSKFHKLL